MIEASGSGPTPNLHLFIKKTSYQKCFSIICVDLKVDSLILKNKEKEDFWAMYILYHVP